MSENQDESALVKHLRKWVDSVHPAATHYLRTDEVRDLLTLIDSPKPAAKAEPRAAAEDGSGLCTACHGDCVHGCNACGGSGWRADQLEQSAATAEALSTEALAEVLYKASIAQYVSVAGEFGPGVLALLECLGIKTFADVPEVSRNNWLAIAEAARGALQGNLP